MRYLLFPDEERTLIRHLNVELGLQYICSDCDPPDLDPETKVNDEFPVLFTDSQPVLYFWCSEIGPIRKLGDAPPPHDTKDKVHLQLNRDAFPDDWEEHVDLSRTPVISWRRPSWYNDDRKCLVAGRLGSTTAKENKRPHELRRLYKRVEYWLRKPAVKINPFQHCTNSPVPEPKNLNMFWILAWSKGKEWVDQGGELWPWDG